ncbi:MAG: UDP-N-acetylmuramate dehydrogenase [Bacteroidia bacterium]
MHTTYDPIRQAVSLRPHHTFGLDVQCRWWKTLRSEDDARAFVMDNLHSTRPLLILGGGSNVLFLKDYDGIVLKNEILGREVVAETPEAVWLRVGAGENWHDLVLHCVAAGWGGIENLALIPGSVGAAPIQNIGAYGVELKDVFDSLEALDLRSGSIRTFDREACRFGYRDSVFKQEARGRYLITRVTLRLHKPPHVLHTSYGAIAADLALRPAPHSIRDVSEVVTQIRQRKLPDPRQIGNAGSFFKNPVIAQAQFEALQARFPAIPSYPDLPGYVKVPAGWLIEQAGWKGHQRGACGVHSEQALVLVNHGGATGAEIYALSEDILQDIAARYGITLEREVNIVG